MHVELRQEGTLKFDASLGYIMSSRPEWATQGDPTSRNFGNLSLPLPDCT